MAALIQAFCDESGTDPKRDSHCVVGGFIASGRNWQIFEERWRRASESVDFHGRRFFGREKGQRVPPYRGWSDEKATAYLNGLLDTIIDTTTHLKVIGVVIEHLAFSALTPAERHLITGAGFRSIHHRDTPRQWKMRATGAPTLPYFVGFTRCISQAIHGLTKPGLTVDFFFDRNDHYEGHARRAYHLNRQHALPELQKRLGDLFFKSSAGIGGLQAADLLVHTAYRRIKHEPGVNRELDHATERLGPICNKRIPIMDRAGFADYLGSLPADLRSQKLKGN